MKVAVLHDYMDNIGGAEQAALTMARLFDGVVYTTNVDFEVIGRMGFGDVEVKSIGWVPVNAPFRQELTKLRFSCLDLSGFYDAFIISGSWVLPAAVKNKPNIWYLHSPTRELWDLREHVRDKLVWPPLRPLFDVWAGFNRRVQLRLIKHVGLIAANSANVRERVKRYYGRDSAVVYGAVYTDRFKFIGNGDFWLSVNRLIPHKRVELQLEVFRRLPKEKLVIVGCFEKSKHFIETERRIRASKPDNVTLLSYVSQGELERLYGECKGFIATALDEDMGLTPIEAMAAGKPVVAVNEGGYRETVVDGVTGRLVSADVDALVDAVKEVSANSERFKSACEERAREFDVNVFKVRMRALLDKCVGLGGNEGRSTL